MRTARPALWRGKTVRRTVFQGAACESTRSHQTKDLPKTAGLLFYDLNGPKDTQNHPHPLKKEDDDMADTDKNQPVKQFEGFPLENLISGPLAAAAKGKTPLAGEEDMKQWEEIRSVAHAVKRNDSNE